eukprot:CAMPEP_0184520622 /NCGR_PEP_ID=MMETSP0198_2-20121128/7272_1 /TAXON_ID=1112570 /ORGANISM="Thraustochytrium sp., Strain LLF1b" /LENGTH=229 /DNA_ID=CAMNT_0026911245 /DNA_START=146 /DNA_END=835 /DNA_ORIENTATION=+
MKTVGVIGGMGWPSSMSLYKLLNEGVNAKLGGNETCKMVLFSVNFGEIAALQKTGDYTKIGQILAEAAQGLERAGADCVMICCNTQHIVADVVKKSISIPFLHVVDLTATTIKAKGCSRPLLLGSHIVTDPNEFFYKMLQTAGLSPLAPVEEDRQFINDTIFNELSRNEFKDSTRDKFIEMIKRYECDCVILACTEIGMLLTGDIVADMPAIDTVQVLVQAGVEFATQP